MKKILIIGIILIMAISFTGCDTGSAALKGTEEITMASIDKYIDTDARFVDLRNFSDQLSAGYITGFELVPFFQFLEGRALVRNNGWEFSAADIAGKAVLENIFGDKEGAIVLMCGSGTRAGYVKAALEEIGYTKVYNAGGIKDYSGTNKILGDGVFNGAAALPAEVNMKNIDTLLARPNAKYVDLRNVNDKYSAGYINEFELISFFEYLDDYALFRNTGWDFTSADIANKAVLENIFGDMNQEIFLMCGSGTRAGYVKAALDEIGYKTVYNVGGIKDYEGKNKVLGDADFILKIK
ncbi:MAG: rhodanese-like domain-containing protein [Spirochaetia bacterium]|nr:rhodanese-like domain-containing protein [Spirochaetia bacterium]